MKHYNKYFFLLLNILIIAFTVYLTGCISSPETTTGKLAFQQKDFEKAETELTKGVAADKEDMEAWYMLGVSRVEIGKYEEARIPFEKSKTAFSYEQFNYWVLKYNDGIKQFNDGLSSKKNKDSVGAIRNFGKALISFKASAIIIPDSITSYQMMGDCYSYIGKTDSALIVYTAILDKSKSKDDAINIAKIMYKNGIEQRQAENYDGALKIFNRIITINYLPKDNTYYETSVFNIGYCNYAIAEKAVKDGKDFKPYLNEAVNNLDPLSKSIKDKDLLNATYEILINCYDALGQQDKKDEVAKKKLDLQNK
jgi:tetratricopeptide (TPR) repeat protein